MAGMGMGIWRLCCPGVRCHEEACRQMEQMMGSV